MLKTPNQSLKKATLRSAFNRFLWVAMTLLACLSIYQGQQFYAIVLCLLMLLLKLDELTDQAKEAVAQLELLNDKTGT